MSYTEFPYFTPHSPFRIPRSEVVPRQGIEPCMGRLKAGCFAIEACEASMQRRMQIAER